MCIRFGQFITTAAFQSGYVISGLLFFIKNERYELIHPINFEELLNNFFVAFRPK